MNISFDNIVGHLSNQDIKIKRFKKGKMGPRIKEVVELEYLVDIENPGNYPPNRVKQNIIDFHSLDPDDRVLQYSMDSIEDCLSLYKDFCNHFGFTLSEDAEKALAKEHKNAQHLLFFIIERSIYKG